MKEDRDTGRSIPGLALSALNIVISLIEALAQSAKIPGKPRQIRIAGQEEVWYPWGEIGGYQAARCTCVRLIATLCITKCFSEPGEHIRSPAMRQELLGRMYYL